MDEQPQTTAPVTGIQSACGAKQAIASLLTDHIATAGNPHFVEAAASGGPLVVAAVDSSGKRRNFKITVEEVADSPLPADMQRAQPHEAAGETKEGCCGSPSTCSTPESQAQAGQEPQEAAPAASSDNG